MRSSKSRSRSKSNRNRPSGSNVINRVFDSSGPEGKVRGTPQQIIDKYNQLARDAQLANDRVAAENFQQHAEHYLRLLSEAQREIDARREEQERQNRERQAERDRERSERQDRDTNTAPERDKPAGGEREKSEDPLSMADDGSETDTASTLVETPENRGSDDAAPQASDTRGDAQAEASSETAGADQGLDKPASEKPKRKPRARKPAAPRTRKAAPKGEGGDAPDDGGDPAQAAE